MSYESHQRDAAGVAVNCAVITISDTRTPADDAGGGAIQRLVAEAGHKVAHYQIVRDEPAELNQVLDTLISRPDVDAILLTGGTGISRRDQTICVVEKRLETILPGFGELFRMLSWEQIGSGAMLSRAAGGVAGGKLLFAMPGSTKAVELAMSKLILPELRHLISELRKQT
jgi:molybdenum cofactor biosynthesis protein B